MTEDRLRELFREMRDEPIPADSLARVRLGVAAKVRPRRARAVGSLALASLCALILMLPIRSPDRLPLPAPRVPAPPPDSFVVRPAVIRSEPHPAIKRRQVAQRAAEKPVLIRIETADPEVVILLVGN